MATIFKNFLNSDVANTRTLLNEAIPITGTILSGTYGAYRSESNVKNFAHDMFQSVYDYPYLSSSSNHLLDITFGFSANSGLSSSSPVDATRQRKQINIYNSMAQVLAGYDLTGSVREFDEDGNLTGGTKISECVFLNFARLLTKDEIKKGAFSLYLGEATNFSSPMSSLMTIQDTDAQNNYFINSPAGEYGILYGTGSAMPADTKVGLIFYQAGVVVLTGAIFQDYGSNGGSSGSMEMDESGKDWETLLTSSALSESANGLRNRINNITFNNTTELNSTIYFCRANHNEFNYSSNPTYLSGSKINVKNNSFDLPISYITTVGLYSADNELLAVAKLSEPLRKDPTVEHTLRVRIDY